MMVDLTGTPQKPGPGGVGLHIDIQSVLFGTRCGRERQTWEHAVRDMQEGKRKMDVRQCKDLTRAINCVKTAESLTPVLLVKMAMAEIKTKFLVLTDANHTIPTCHQMIIARISAIEESETHQFASWATMVVVSWIDITDKSVEFNIAKGQNSFANIVYDPDASPESVKQMCEHWPAAVFVNVMWVWIDEVDVDDNRNKLIDMLQHYVRGMAAVDAERMGLQKGEDFLFLWRSVGKAVRGLLGLASPKPGLASLEDVRYIYPSNSQNLDGIVADIPVLGRSLVMALRTGSVKLVWKEFYNSFQQSVGYAEQQKDDYKQFEQDLESVLNDVNASQVLTVARATALVDVLGTFSAQIKAWKGGLREDACEHIMEDMTRLCSAAFLRLSSTDPWAQQCVQALTVALNFLDNDWLKQQVSDFSLRMEAGQVEDALQQSVAQLQINIDVQGLEDVVNKLSASADVDPQLIVKARALFEKVVGYAVNEGIRLLESADAEIQKGWVAISSFCQAVGLGTDHAAWTQIFNNMAAVVKSSIALCQAAPQRDHATDTLQDVLVPLDPFLVPLCKAIKGMKVALATVQVSTTDSVNLLETFKTKAWPLAMEIVHHRVEMPIRSTLQALCDDAVQNARELKRVCGGNPTGGNWSAKRPDSTPILDWAQTTLVALTKVDSQNMATFSTSATEANNLRSIHKT